MPEVVWCYIERRGDNWEAVCLNFDLAVQGNSFREVQEKLDRAIHEYLDYVKSLPTNEQAQFLRRQVPLLTLIRFALLTFWTTLKMRGRGGGGHVGYTVACPA